MKKNNNEIDLVDLLLKLFIYTKKYFFVFAVAIVLGLVYGYIQNRNVAYNFKSEMIIVSKIQNELDYNMMPRMKKEYNTGNVDIIDNIIKSAQKQISSRNYEYLSKRTGLTVDELKSVISISSKAVANDNSADFDYIEISASTKDKEIFTKLGKGIENYINNNEYIKRNNLKDSILISNLIKETNQKLEILSQYQDKTIKPNSNTEMLVVGENSVFGESVDMLSYKLKLEQELHSIKTARILENFFIPAGKTAASTRNLIIYPAIFFIISIFIVIILILNKKAKSINRAPQQKENN